MNKAVALIEPRFLATAEVLELHDSAIDNYGGSSGLRDPGLLESALAQPKQAFGGEFAHQFPFGMAAAYGFHIAKNHPFIDGNKRVGFLAAYTFLHINHWQLDAADAEAGDAVTSVAAGSIDRAAFAAWLEQRSRPLLRVELREFLRDFTLDRATRFVETVAASGREAEAAATSREAAAAIPLIAQLHDQAESLLRDATTEEARAHAHGLGYTSVLLTAMYRVAEDQGYEW